MARSVVAGGLGHRLLAWAALYLVVALAPLGVILLGDTPPERGFWVEFGVALGFVGLAMMCLQAVLTARFSTVSMALGQDTLLQFHRQAGLIAFAMVMLHPVILIAANTDNWAFLDPRDNLLRAPALWFVLVVFPALVVTSLWRERFGLSYQWWRLGHGVAASLLVVVGLVHITRVEYYLASRWKLGVWLALGIASVACVAYVRLLTPLRQQRHPYRVASVDPVADGTWRVTVTPDAGPALPFRPGQFAFVTIQESPFHLEQHPFSLASSSERRDNLEFAIKELGDYTSTIGQVPVGARAFVDGPYGGMVLDVPDGGGLFAVAGGIGISPILSMVRTLADRDQRPPVVLVYANNRWGSAAYAAELDELADRLGDDLTVVHVLAEAPSDWDGERGVVTADLLEATLPTVDRDRWQYVVCGPAPMMEAVEASLLGLGVPLGSIESERFDIGAAVATGRRHTNVRRLVILMGAVLVAASAAFAW